MTKSVIWFVFVIFYVIVWTSAFVIGLSFWNDFTLMIKIAFALALILLSPSFLDVKRAYEGLFKEDTDIGVERND